MAPATTLPCVWDPDRTPSQLLPESSTVWMEWILRWNFVPTGLLVESVWVADWENSTAS